MTKIETYIAAGIVAVAAGALIITSHLSYHTGQQYTIRQLDDLKVSYIRAGSISLFDPESRRALQAGADTLDNTIHFLQGAPLDETVLKQIMLYDQSRGKSQTQPEAIGQGPVQTKQ